MNTFCTIEAEGDEQISAQDVIEAAFSELRRIENIFSRYRADSEVYRLNQNASKSAVKTDSEVFELISRCLGFSKKASGAFDITVGAAIDFWRLCEETGTMPLEAQLGALRENVGYQKLQLDSKDESVYFSSQAMQIDLGAVAKGYALGRAVSVLKQRAVSQAQVNLGGNIYTIGGKPQKIAIRNPLLSYEAAATVELFNSSISTSANYERFFTVGDNRFGHLLNPLTCCPVESDILSVSVISQDAVLADALSTAIFVLGFDKAKELVKDFEGIQLVVVCKRGSGNSIKIHKMKGGRAWVRF